MASSTAPNADLLYVQRGGVIKGPFPVSRLRDFAEQGRLQASDTCCETRDGPWIKVSDLSIFRDVLRKPETRKPERAAESPNTGGGLGFLGSITSRAKAIVSDALEEASREIDHTEFVTVTEKLIVGRLPEHADWLIHDPSVSRQHALIYKHQKGLVLRDLTSRLGVVVNNRKLKPGVDTLLAPKDLVRIGPAVLEVGDNGFYVRTRTGHAHLEAVALCKDVAVAGQARKRILHDVFLDVRPGTFSVVIGPSGSGKSTLLQALNGRSLATRGDVFLNGENVYTNYEVLRTRMATVPQRDLQHDTLSVSSALTFTANLRLPKDLSDAEKSQRVSEVLAEVEMVGLADARIRTLSGGQVKRISLANELLSKPSLLFIDEATSGLDESSDREIMSMLRRLADTGRTIICVTHNLGHVEDYAHQVVVMANGGHLAFVGPPGDAKEYFSVPKLGAVYTRLAERNGLEWARAFTEDPRSRYRSLVDETARNQGAKLVIAREKPTTLQEIGQACRQGLVIATRMAALQKADQVSLYVGIAQPLCIFILIALVFGKVSSEAFVEGQKIVFLLCISAFWLGCSNSAKEIVKEKELVERERRSGLSALGYLGAKAAFLSVLSLSQSVGLYVLTAWFVDLPGNFIMYALSLAAIALCGVALGLTISAVSSNTDIAATAVPLAVIPQVILAGVLHPLTGWAERFAMVASPTFWCTGAMTNRLYWAVFDSAFLKERLLPMASQYSAFGSLLITLLFAAVLFGVAGVALTGTRILKFEWCDHIPGDIDEWVRSAKDGNPAGYSSTDGQGV